MWTTSHLHSIVNKPYSNYRYYNYIVTYLYSYKVSISGTQAIVAILLTKQENKTVLNRLGTAFLVAVLDNLKRFRLSTPRAAAKVGGICKM